MVLTSQNTSVPNPRPSPNFYWFKLYICWKVGSHAKLSKFTFSTVGAVVHQPPSQKYIAIEKNLKHFQISTYKWCLLSVLVLLVVGFTFKAQNPNIYLMLILDTSLWSLPRIYSTHFTSFNHVILLYGAMLAITWSRLEQSCQASNLIID